MESLILLGSTLQTTLRGWKWDLFSKAITLVTQIELSHKGAESLTCRGGENCGEINFTNIGKPTKSMAIRKYQRDDVKKKLYTMDVGVHIKHQNVNSKVKSAVTVVKLDI